MVPETGLAELERAFLMSFCPRDLRDQHQNQKEQTIQGVKWTYRFGSFLI